MTETKDGTAKVTLPADDQILITREFAAPRHLVYRAWTTPDLVKRWWSGQRGKVTIAEIDLRVGGSWRYVMIANGGFEVGFHGVYNEIDSNERIVSTEFFEGMLEAGSTLNTTTFAEVDGRTVLTLLIQCPNQMVRDAILESGMEGGMQEQMDALEAVSLSLG
jgi:uncharacterized protein YndB with AHSA1/START domain